jgi:hypothetical protein
MDSQMSIQQNDKIIPEKPEFYSQGSSSEIYTFFEDLPNLFQGSKDLNLAIEELKELSSDKYDWKTHFDLIDQLRSLNKFYPEIMNQNLDFFTSFIQKSMNSLRSNLTKNALILVREIFEQSKDCTPSFDFLKVIIHSTLDRAISDKAFIKNEARAAMKVLEKNGFNDSIIQILCEKSFDKNASISELSFLTIAEIAKEGKENLLQRLSFISLQILFETIAKAVNGKRSVIIKAAEGICQQFKGIFPENQESFDDFLRNNLKLKDNEVNAILNAAKEKKSRPSKSDFANFIKEQKSMKEGEKNDGFFVMATSNCK